VVVEGTSTPKLTAGCGDDGRHQRLDRPVAVAT
jgi:hypothetical protein